MRETAVFVVCGALSCTPALAQQPAQERTGARALEELVVTARRREERLQDVPQSIAALRSEELVARNVFEMKDITTLVPNFSLNNYGAQRTRRGTQTLGMRGIVPRGSQGTGVFINGAPASGGFAANVGDLERVEVLRGPQSAYFGRATYAGAVNFVTKAPSPDWGGSVEAYLGSDSLTEVRGSVEGPLVDDSLSFRLSARRYAVDGQYRNAWDQGRLTDKQTTSFSSVIDFNPRDTLSATLVVVYSHDRDGLPTYAKFNGRMGDFNCAAGAAGASLNYLCGRLPEPFPADRIGASFPLTPAIVDFLYNNSAGFPNPDNSNKMSNHIGDEAKYLHSNIRIDYTPVDGMLSGATASYLGAINTSRTQILTNSFAEPLFENQADPDNPLVPFNPAFLVFSAGKARDMYHEVRLASGSNSALTWLGGASYFRNYPSISSLRGLIPSGPANFTGTNKTFINTFGVFGALNYAFTEQLIGSVEGRYQSDRVKLENLAGTALVSSNDKSFMPRVSLQYSPWQDSMLYGSWARGENPQNFNNSLVGVPQVVIDSVVAQTGASAVVEGDRLDMYELGIKGTFLDGRVAFDGNVFLGQWKNQIIQQRVTAPNPNNPATNTTITVLTNLGESEVKGFELALSAALTEKLLLSLTYGQTDSKIKEYFCAPCLLSITGSADVRGNRFAQIPAKSGNMFLEYRDALGSRAEWYVNTQYVHQGRIYMDETNLAWSGSRNTVDLRLGLTTESMNFEVFVLNAFDDYYYSFAQRDTDQRRLGVPFDNGFYVNLPEKRQVGVRVRYTF